MKTITKEGKKYYLASEVDFVMEVLVDINGQMLAALEGVLDEIDCRNKSGENAWALARQVIAKAKESNS
jgi:hypothetical protein